MNIKEVNPEHNLYLIRVYGKEGSLIKLGYSSDIRSRVLSYYMQNPLIELVDTFYREDAKEFEHLLHRCLESKVMNEWYKEAIIDEILDFINNGIDEDIEPIYTSGGRSKKPEFPLIEGEGVIARAVRKSIFDKIDWTKE